MPGGTMNYDGALDGAPPRCDRLRRARCAVNLQRFDSRSRTEGSADRFLL